MPTKKKTPKKSDKAESGSVMKSATNKSVAKTKKVVTKKVSKKKPAVKKTATKKTVAKKESVVKKKLVAKKTAAKAIKTVVEELPVIDILEEQKDHGRMTKIRHRIVFVGSCKNCEHIPMKVSGLIAVMSLIIAVLSGMLLTQSSSFDWNSAIMELVVNVSNFL